MLPGRPGQADFPARQMTLYLASFFFHLPDRQGPKQVVYQLNDHKKVNKEKHATASGHAK